MVAKISLPEDDCIDLLTRILEERVKYKVFYNRISVDLAKQYSLYVQEKGCPANMEPMDLAQYVDSALEAEKRKKSLIALYSPDEDKLPYSQLEKLRKKNKLLACPVCGEPGRPRTLDHCLPKAVYPEFSVNLLNLVPACDWCQGEKLSEYKTAAGGRSFIHPYFDDVNRPLCRILFSEPYLTPVISLKVREDLTSDMQTLVATHLEGIDFFERFKEHFEVTYQIIKRLASKTRNSQNISVVEAMENAYWLAAEKGINSWDAVLYRSILEDDNILEFLTSGELSDFP